MTKSKVTIAQIFLVCYKVEFVIGLLTKNSFSAHKISLVITWKGNHINLGVLPASDTIKQHRYVKTHSNTRDKDRNRISYLTQTPTRLTTLQRSRDAFSHVAESCGGKWPEEALCTWAFSDCDLIIFRIIILITFFLNLNTTGCCDNKGKLVPLFKITR